jgi:hypothetical protein
MQTVDEKPLETIHLYVVREDERKSPSLLPLILSFLCLLSLVVITVYSVNAPAYTHKTIRVPAIFPPLQTFTAQAPVIPTGSKTYPATTAQGIITITNGSIISQTLPKGMIIGEVILDYSVFVPAGSANGFGFATVSAHAAVSGKTGNIPALSIDLVEGSSLYIRNLTAFQGGKDSYTFPLQLPQDRQTALAQARTNLAKLVQNKALLAYPCREAVSGVVKLVVQWACQFFTYSVSPLVHITKVKLLGKTVIVDGFIVVRPKPFMGK